MDCRNNLLNSSIPLRNYGIDSLTSIQIRNKFQTDLKCRIPVNFLFSYPTIHEIVAHLNNLPLVFLENSAGNPLPKKASIKTKYRNYSVQQKRWLSLVEIGYGQRVVPIVFDLPLDHKLFTKALHSILERHELLRYKHLPTNIEVMNVEEVVPSTKKLFIDLRMLSIEEQSKEIAKLVEQAKLNMPDVSLGACWDIVCIHLSEEKFCILISLQHLEFDGTSLTTFEEELALLYQYYLEGKPSCLEEAVPYYEYVEWQQDYINSHIAEDRGFFNGLFSSLSNTTILPGKDSLKVTIPLESKRFTPQPLSYLNKEIEEYAARHNVTVFSVIFANYAYLVSYITGEEEVVISIINSGRANIKFKKTIGPFTAPFPVKVTMLQNNNNLINSCNKVIASINARSYYPVTDLIYNNDCFKDLPENTYFSDVGINFTNYRKSEGYKKVRTLEILGPLSEKEFSLVNTADLRRIPGLHLVVSIKDEQLFFNFWYHASRFQEAQVKEWSNIFMEKLLLSIR